MAGGRPRALRSGLYPGSSLIEVPVTTAEAGRTATMAAGGAGFPVRALPMRSRAGAVERANLRDGRPAAFDFHRWEIDPDQPRRADAPPRSRFRHDTNLGAMAGKLQRLLGAFSWGRMDAVVGWIGRARLGAEGIAA